MSENTKLLLMTGLFAIIGVFVKLLTPEFGIFPQMSLRMALSAAILAALPGTRASLTPIPAREWRVALVRAIFLTLIGGGFYIAALMGGKLGVVSFITCIPYEAVWGAMLFRERLARLEFMGYLIAICGIWILSGAELGTSTGGIFLVYALISGLSWAFGVALCKYHAPNLGRNEINLISAISGALWAGIGALVLEPGDIGPVSLNGCVLLLLSALAVTGALALLNDLTRTSSLMKIGLVGLLQPVLSAFFGYVFLSEAFTTAEVYGSAVILIGLATFSRAQRI